MEQYRIVVVGCGNMSKAWIEYVAKRDDSIITALVDVRPEAAEAMKVSGFSITRKRAAVFPTTISRSSYPRSRLSIPSFATSHPRPCASL